MYEGTPLKQPPETPTGSYAFAFNVDGAQLEAPIELIPGHVLRKPTDAQIAELKVYIPELTNADGEPVLAGRWEVDIGMVPGGGWIIGGRTPREDWRYAVIDLTGSHDRTYLLQLAMNLSSPQLVIGLRHLVTEQGAQTILDDVMLRILDRPADNLLLPMTPDQVEELRTLTQKIERHDNRSLDLESQFGRFDALRHVNRGEFVFLGYFTILESLLAHKPLPEDRYDSISRQVVGKMRLLSRRFVGELDTERWFPGLTPEKMWKKLYQYRSDIAHGNAPDFARDLQPLVRPDWAREFMHDTVRKLLRHALDEPDLIRDLKGVTI